MSGNELMVREDVALDAYGKVGEVRELTRRLMAMLPSAKDLGPAGAGALAQASLAMGLNPFIGQIWAIPQGGRNRDGVYDTYGIMVGISGLRAKAHEQAKADGGMYTVTYRIARAEEIEGLQINSGDIVRACDLVVSGKKARAHLELTQEVPRYTGIGVYRNGERTKMNPLQVARKRAEAEAIKQAFDVPLSFISGPGQVDDIEIDDMPERYEEHGDGLVNGTHIEDADFEDATGDPWLNGDHPTEPEPPQEPPTARRSWPDATIQAIMDANLARPAKHVIKMLNLSKVLRTTDDLALALEWANHYRGQREDGVEPDAAAQYADKQLEGIEEPA